MLSGTEKTKNVEGFYGAPSMTFPHPVKNHLKKFSEAELHPLRRELARKLSRMHYVMQLEQILDLHDCYDAQDEKRLLQNEEPSSIKNSQSVSTPFLIFLPVIGFLAYKKANPLHFSSYVNNIYGVAYTAVLSAAFTRWIFARKEFQYALRNQDDWRIVSAKAEIHSECMALTNKLRFNVKSELTI